MKINELTEIFKWFSGAYPEFRPDENMANVWLEILKAVPDGYALAGAKEWSMHTHPYQKFPTAANIRETAFDLYNRTVEAQRKDYFERRDAYDKLRACYPGAYDCDPVRCSKLFNELLKYTRPSDLIGATTEFVKTHEKMGIINELKPFEEYLKEKLDEYTGRDGCHRITPD